MLFHVYQVDWNICDMLRLNILCVQSILPFQEIRAFQDVVIIAIALCAM